MRTTQLSTLVAVAGSAAVATAAGVVPMSIQHTGRSKVPFRKRADDTYTETITNNVSYGGYFASVAVGSDKQSQQVILDTGSSDTWFLDSDASLCESSSSSGSSSGPGGFRRRQSSSSCVSTFDTSSSTSYTNTSEVFEISYVDGSEVSGYYFTDSLEIGGATIDSVQMGLADDSDIYYGIMGIGFTANEAADTKYRNVIDKFYDEGLISARAYSLWMDDLASSSGTILFGGIDTDKYTGSLISVPIIKDSSANNYTSFSITLSSVASLNGDGSTKTNFTESEDGESVILDSGTTLTYLPESMATSILDEFNATYDSSAGYAYCSCSLAEDSNVTMAFQFGGYDGPTITVSLAELVLQTGSGNSFGQGGSGSDSSSSDDCTFGISYSSTLLLGDTFLRSAYVVYDLDSKEIALAQSNTNSNTTSIQTITQDGGIPEVSSTASSTVASSTSSFGGSRKSAAGGPPVASVGVALAAVAAGFFVGVLGMM